MNIKSSKTLVTEALSEIKTISPDEALSMMNEDKCNLIDIRDIRELERDGRVENSNHIPRGMLEFWVDPQSPYYRRDFGSGKKFIFFCAGGMRSALAAQAVQKMGLNPVAHMAGGFGEWEKANGPVEEKPFKKPK